MGADAQIAYATDCLLKCWPERSGNVRLSRQACPTEPSVTKMKCPRRPVRSTLTHRENPRRAAELLAASRGTMKQVRRNLNTHSVRKPLGACAQNAEATFRTQ
eukprot:TRINITY_DN17336_c0_g1_i1.p3 TRINITY_DN17336_c0_g1~~TRINITY_DN17336_c0_g1_i1.p3  ORF type:complete len:103 (+),score=7.22 TRINITY_DN17336_c0_g1_i1:293-601(+)